VIAEDLQHQRMPRVTVRRKCRQQVLLLLLEVVAPLAIPELEELAAGRGGALFVGAAQLLGDDQCLMVVAGQDRQGFAALQRSALRGVRSVLVAPDSEPATVPATAIMQPARSGSLGSKPTTSL